MPVQFPKITTSDPATILFITLDGVVNLAGDQVADITREGTDGMAHKILGKKGVPYNLRSTGDYADKASAQAAREAYAALKGRIVTVTTIEDGVTSVEDDNQMVLEVSSSIRKLVNAAGGVVAGNYLITANWTFVDTNP